MIKSIQSSDGCSFFLGVLEYEDLSKLRNPKISEHTNLVALLHDNELFSKDFQGPTQGDDCQS